MKVPPKVGSLSVCLLLAVGPAPVSGDEAVRHSLISLNSQVIDTRGPGAGIPAALRAPAGSEYVLVKFPGPVSASQYEALQQATERIYTYLPYDTYLVKMKSAPDAGRALQAKSVGASWTGPYHPAYKLSRSMSALAAPDAAAAPGDAAPGRQIVMVQVFPDADLDKVVAAIRSAGAREVVGSQRSAFFSRVRLLLEPAQIVATRAALARIPEVFWIDIEPRRVLLNDTTIWVGQSGVNGGQATPVFDRGIFGEGQIVGVLDTGIDPDMCYFRDTVRGLPPRNECNRGTVRDLSQRKVVAVDFLWSNECNGGIAANEWDTQGHGSHVAGTIAGDNFLNPLNHDPGDGMAPGAKLVVQDCGFQTNDCADCPGIGCPVVDLNPVFQQAYDQGARIHTNSWGDQENASVQNNYTAGSQDVDEFMWNHKDMLIFFAAGNSGPGARSVGSPSTAKSAVSVGATQRGSSSNAMAGFSSCGPTDDGRIKPEITIPGQGIGSARNDGSLTSNNCGTASLSGTSMASPGAAGLTALIRQYYAQGWYPSGIPTAADAFAPSAALMRATLINSAAAMTGAPVIPGNCQGWGRALLDSALFFPGDARRLWVRDDDAGFPLGSSGESRSFTFTVTSAAEPFKATLAWTDFPSTPAANPHINDDLDLAVSGPGGSFLGNVFSGGRSAAGGSADRRNTLEQVLIMNPAPGTYTVTVRSFSVPNGPQPFALVVTGAAAPGGGGNLPPHADAGPDQNVALGGLVALDGGASNDPDGGPSPLAFSWTQLSGPPVSLGTPGQARATFTPAAAGTYVFRLQVSDGAAADADEVSVSAAAGPTTVFLDTFEAESGWTSNAAGTDTATTGQWERGDPEPTDSSGPKQLGTTVSGVNALVTGRLAGVSAGANDVDGGVTSIQSPPIALPAGPLTLSFSFYLAHGTNSSTADFLRVRVVGATSATVFQELGGTEDDDAVWAAATADLSAFAGQTVRLVVEAADAAAASLVEAAVDDVKITTP